MRERIEVEGLCCPPGGGWALVVMLVCPVPVRPGWRCPLDPYSRQHGGGSHRHCIAAASLRIAIASSVRALPVGPVLTDPDTATDGGGPPRPPVRAPRAENPCQPLDFGRIWHEKCRFPTIGRGLCRVDPRRLR
jgi:hypothetical protein